MLVPDQEVQSKAKEEEIGDAASRAPGRADILPPVPEPVVYSRETLFTGVAKSSEVPPKDHEVRPSIALDPSTKCQPKGAMRVNLSAPYEPTGVGKALQHKCIAWRSNALDCSSHSMDSQRIRHQSVLVCIYWCSNQRAPMN